MKNNRKNRKLIFIIYKNLTGCRISMLMIAYTLPEIKFSKRRVFTYKLFSNSILHAAARKYKVHPKLLGKGYKLDTPTFVNNRDLAIKKQWAEWISVSMGFTPNAPILPAGTLVTLGTNKPVHRPKRNLTMIVDDIDDAPALGSNISELLNARMKDPPKKQYLTMIGYDVYLNGKKLLTEDVNIKTNDKNGND